MRKAKEILSILLHFAHEKPFPPFPTSSSCQNNLLKICRVGTKKRGFPTHTQKEATDFDACYTPDWYPTCRALSNNGPNFFRDPVLGFILCIWYHAVDV